MNLNHALRLTQKSRHKQHHHAAFVVAGGKIQSVGYNVGKTHAEVKALKQLWPNKRKGTKVYSMRWTKGGKWGMSKPCPRCEAYMREAGVKVVYYVDLDGQMQRIRL